MLLLFGALVISIIIVGKYGFLTLILVCSVMLAASTIGYFMVNLMDKDKVLRPAKRKIRRWHAVATAVVVQEIRDFQLDMNEHLLLTNGSAHDDIYEYGMADNNGDVAQPTGGKKKRRGPRSKVFKLLVKPFLKKKNGQRFRFRRKKATDDTAGNSSSSVADSGHEYELGNT